MTKTVESEHSFANPYIACTACGQRVIWYQIDTGNVPCGHKPNGDDAWKSVCPSWGPVDGCTCKERFGYLIHSKPVEAS